IVSLSSMDHDTLKGRLGMGDPILVKTGDSPQGFLGGIHDALNGYKKPCDLAIIVKTVAAWDCASIFGLLKTYTENINDCVCPLFILHPHVNSAYPFSKSEAAARIIIDPWIISGMQLVKKIKANYRTVLFPELLVSSLRSQTDLPAMIEYQENVTFLTGTIDYVTLNYNISSISDDSNDRQRTIGVYNVKYRPELSIDPWLHRHY
ncbi:hypothetical protein C0993_010523, partial [Termitomyces sp. T159_Od127]